MLQADEVWQLVQALLIHWKFRCDLQPCGYNAIHLTDLEFSQVITNRSALAKR